MKKNIFQMLLLLMTAALTAACSSDSETTENAPAVINPDEALTPIRITANYAGDDVRSNATRVSYSEDGSDISATWQAGDKIKVVYNGNVSTLDLESGAGTASAIFTGTISGTPSATSMLICYVSDQNNTSAVTINTDGSYTYTDGTFLAQDGTLAGAAKCNLYYGSTFYGTGEDISCDFAVNTSMMKFTVFAPDGVSAGDEATLTYKSNGTAISKATFTVGAGGKNTIYLTIPAGQYTGEQTLVYNETSKTLSATKANFVAGETYSKEISYGTSVEYQVNSSNWETAIASFNAEETPNPKLIFTSDISWSLDSYIQARAITRADGVIDFDGHTVTHMFLQNNVTGKKLTLMNGTVVGDASWHIALDTKTEFNDFYKGTVTLDNMTVPGNIFIDGHLYIIMSGTYHKIFNYTGDGCPGKLIIYGGYFADNIHEYEGTSSPGTYELYGGKYAIRPEDSWCASGYSVKSNTDDDSSTYPYIVSAD